MIDTADTALAIQELQAWIGRDPDSRYVREIRQFGAKWRVGLQAGADELTSSEDVELRGAIRNALMIAALAGHS